RTGLTITRSSFAYSRMPMCRIRAACCARAASGHVAAPPITFMNSRRRIAAPEGQTEHAPAQISILSGSWSVPDVRFDKRTFRSAIGMSALPPKADMCGAKENVRYGPIADINDAKPSANADDQAVNRYRVPTLDWKIFPGISRRTMS